MLFMEEENKVHKRNDWENHHVLHIDREPMHVPLGAYENEEQAALCN